jgi:hypothetical protein
MSEERPIHDVFDAFKNVDTSFMRHATESITNAFRYMNMPPRYTEYFRDIAEQESYQSQLENMAAGDPELLNAIRDGRITTKDEVRLIWRLRSDTPSVRALSARARFLERQEISKRRRRWRTKPSLVQY